VNSQESAYERHIFLRCVYLVIVISCVLTIMSFDAHAYHIEKSRLTNYLASPNVLNSTIWQHTSTGLEVVNEEDLLPFTGIVVGRVSAFRLKCGPEGNHINGGVSPLDKSKYQFHITRPANRELAEDYQSAIGTLEALQNQVGRTVQHKNMVIDDVTGKWFAV
jgi:hypothetical protein